MTEQDPPAAPLARRKRHRKARKPLTPEQKAALDANARVFRVRRLMTFWVSLDAWKLKDEACLLADEIDPHNPQPIQPTWDDVVHPRPNLFSMTQRAVLAEKLKVINQKDPPEHWLVEPAEFVRYLRSLAGGPSKRPFSRILNELFGSPGSGGSLSARHRVLESGYSTPNLEATFAAAAEFWIPFQEGKRPQKPKSEEVLEWLAVNFPNLKPSVHKEIDRAIRPETLRAGGLTSAKGSKPKR